MFALYAYAVATPTRGVRFLIAMLFVDGLAVITSYDNYLNVNPFLASLGLCGRCAFLVHRDKRRRTRQGACIYHCFWRA